MTQRNDTPRLLIVDPDHDEAFYRDALASLAPTITVAENAREALEAATGQPFDVLLAELNLPDMDGFELLEHTRARHPDVSVILLTAFGSVEDAVTAIQSGASDFLSKPFSADQLCIAVDKAAKTRRLIVENSHLREALDDRLKLENMVGSEPQMLRILKTVKAVAPARTTVLITGESGTGKTLLARGIHQISPRRDGPFVEVNCGALPESLLESELFGHVRGAFTGAVKDRPGKFEAADGGTIFLDEIGTSSPGFQVKLLRVLQDRVIERVGDTKPIPVDVRIILATNSELEQAVAAGTFREDLYYRIQVVALEMPPLRERRGDIPGLAHHFLARYTEETGKQVTGFSQEAMNLLLRSDWPGNIRQLENVVERAVVLTEHQRIQPEDLPASLLPRAGTTAGPESLLDPEDHLRPLKDALLGPERVLIERALAHHRGNRNATANSLGINRTTLFNKMRRFGLL